MGKKIVWSPTSLRQLEEVHKDILEVSKSLNIPDRVIDDIINSVDVLQFTTRNLYIRRKQNEQRRQLQILRS